MDTTHATIADCRRTLVRRRGVGVIVGAAALFTVAVTASAAMAAPPDGTLPASLNAWASPATSEHNARVAEYLLQQRMTANEHNARVAEYLLQQRKISSAHNAGVAEYLLLRHRR
jgi:invasion protein IalB